MREWAASRGLRTFLLLWSAAALLYALSVARRIVEQQGTPRLAAAAGLSAMSGVGLWLLHLGSSPPYLKRRKAWRAGALVLCVLSIVLNSVLIFRTAQHKESLPLVRIWSTLFLLYGLKFLWGATARS